MTVKRRAARRTIDEDGRIANASPEAVLAHGAEIAELTAAALRVARGDGAPLARAERGRRRFDPPAPVRPRDLFDAASLTKPFVATLALRLDASGALPLAARVGDLLPRARPALARRTLESLLRHRGGFVPWYPMEVLDRGGRGAASVADPGERWLEWFAVEAPLGAPPGTYSDLGYLLWGLLAERASGEGLEALLRREVAEPLAIASEVVARPAPERAVECRLDGRREVALAAALGHRLRRPRRVLPGVAQDGNARRLGRLAGHAGLFLSAEAACALATAWSRPGGLLAPPAVARALAGPRGGHALGWARRRLRGSAGAALSAAAFGHTGFTGGSIWIDPERDLVIVMLAHRRSTAIEVNPWRRTLHAWAASRWGSGGRSVARVR